MFDVVIVGAGIVGAAAAWELSKYSLRVAVLEKENDIAAGTTKANSAIIHAGYDPEPGSLMAELNVRGTALAGELFEQLDIPHRKCGSLVVAFAPEELETLEKLRERGERNGVSGLRILNREELREREPQISPSAEGALLAPSAMIVCPWEYTLALLETAVRNGVELYRERRVKDIQRCEGGWRLTTNRETFAAKRVINAAGVHADWVHNLVAKPSFRIIPDRGEYYLLDKSEGDRVNHVVFQCPTRLGKGTLVAPTVHGNLIVGPNNEPPADGEDVATTAEGLGQVAEAARKSVPEVDLRASIRNFAGVRAATEVDDFIIGFAAPGFLDLAGIKSPGLSAAPAIAEKAVEMLAEDGAVLEKREQHIYTRKRLRFAHLSPAEKRALVARDPRYGRVICRCETVTEGEILDAMDTPIPPRSVDGVKRRVGAGMGRCQGGFCAPRIVELQSACLEQDPGEILQDKAGTRILTGGAMGQRKKGHGKEVGDHASRAV